MPRSPQAPCSELAPCTGTRLPPCGSRPATTRVPSSRLPSSPRVPTRCWCSKVFHLCWIKGHSQPEVSTHSTSRTRTRMTEYPWPMPEGSRGGTPTGFQEESEVDPVPTPPQGVTVTATPSGTLTSPLPGQDSLVERLQEQIRILEIRAVRAEQIVQDKCHRRSRASRPGVTVAQG